MELDLYPPHSRVLIPVEQHVAEALGDSLAFAESLKEPFGQKDEMWRIGGGQAAAEMLPPCDWGNLDPERDGEAIRSVRQGPAESAGGNLVDRGSFAQHLEEEGE